MCLSVRRNMEKKDVCVCVCLYVCVWNMVICGSLSCVTFEQKPSCQIHWYREIEDVTGIMVAKCVYVPTSIHYCAFPYLEWLCVCVWVNRLPGRETLRGSVPSEQFSSSSVDTGSIAVIAKCCCCSHCVSTAHMPWKSMYISWSCYMYSGCVQMCVCVHVCQLILNHTTALCIQSHGNIVYCSFISSTFLSFFLFSTFYLCLHASLTLLPLYFFLSILPPSSFASSLTFPPSLSLNIKCLIAPLPPSLYQGAVSGCRCVARVQAPGSSHPQVDGVALQSLQGGVGLAHPAAGHLHCHLDTLLSRIPPQWPGGISSWDRIINQPAVKSCKLWLYSPITNKKIPSKGFKSIQHTILRPN